MENIKSSRQRWLYLLFALIGFTLCFLLQYEWSKKLTTNIADKKIEESNLKYLTQQEENSKEVLLKLAEVYTFLEVIKTSKVGISFFIDVNVQIGNLVKTLSDAAEKGITISTVAMASNLILKSIVKISSDAVPFLFKITLFLLSIYYLNMALFDLYTIGKMIFALFKIGLALFMLTHIVVPYTIHATSVISHYSLNEIKQKNHDHLDHIYNQHIANKQKSNSLKDNAEDAIHRFEKTMSHLPQIVEKTSTFTVYHLALFLLESIIMPIMLLLGFCLSLRQLFSWSQHELQH
jgi:hypothetical protein